MQTREIMTGTTALQTVRPSETATDAIRKMRENKVSALPVVDKDQRVLGMVSERDLVSKFEQVARAEGLKTFPVSLGLLASEDGSESSAEDFNRLARSYSKLGQTSAEEVMTKEVVLANEEDSVGELLQRMADRDINHIPVVREERLVGVVARQDLVSALSGLARKNPRIF